MPLSRKTVWLFTLLYALTVVALASHHVLWRDEARALNIVMASDSIPELFQNLHNEGHPALWYLVLYAGFHLTRSTLVLKASSLVIAIAAVFVFLSRAPFALWHKVLFIFGSNPIYQYSVRCRNYGLSMLFLLLYGALHKHRFEKPFTVALILGLLANTHALALIIAAALWCSLVVEFLMTRPPAGASKRQSLRVVLALLIAVVAMILAVMQLVPDRTTIVTPLYRLDAVTAIRTTALALLHSGEVYATAFGVTSGIFLSFIVLACLVYLLRQVTLALILFLVTTGFATFFALVYPAQGYQKGLLFVLIVVLLWLDAENPPHRVPVRLSRMIEALGARKDTVLSLALLMQFALTMSAVRTDLSAEVSSSRRFGHYLQENVALRDAVVIGEPGAFMESVHYYAANKIYFPRENRYGTWVNYTTASRETLSLQELLAAAEQVQRESRRPVVIAVGHRLSPEGPFERDGVFGSKFVYTIESLDAWRAKTTKLAEFRSATSDENYDVYLLSETSVDAG